jgi:hypothetical protein
MQNLVIKTAKILHRLRICNIFVCIIHLYTCVFGTTIYCEYYDKCNIMCGDLILVMNVTWIKLICHLNKNLPYNYNHINIGYCVQYLCALFVHGLCTCIKINLQKWLNYLVVLILGCACGSVCSSFISYIWFVVCKCVSGLIWQLPWWNTFLRNISISSLFYV